MAWASKGSAATTRPDASSDGSVMRSLTRTVACPVAAISPADLHDSHGGVALLRASRDLWPFLAYCFADRAYLRRAGRHGNGDHRRGRRAGGRPRRLRRATATLGD